jgi:acyl transferase domain-containing protein
MLRQNRISVATLPPSVLSQQPVEPFPDLETLIVAGEACSAEILNKWAPGRRFFNAYGPTEVTVCATIAECVPGGGAPPIGRPIANARVYILDRYGKPAPIGVSGEIYVGGAGVARGYLNRQDLTKERFLKDPFSDNPEARMYRTGDLARFRPDGNIEFLGRIDQQVKIRGFRIELGEIEEALQKRPDVRDTIVIAREDTPGDKRLVAYLVPAGEHALEPGSLREHLRRTLPEYMIPAAFVTVKSLPLTPNGKVDRAALPALNEALRDVTHHFVAPRSEMEGALCAIWCDVLGLDHVGIEEPFFDLGGDSLLLARVRSEIADRMGMDVDMVALFQHPSIQKLAAYLRPSAQERTEVGIEIARIVARATQPPPPLEPSGDIAIIGMVGQFPGARSVEELWDMLREVREGITHYTPEELEMAGMPADLVRSPGFVPAAGIIDDPVCFDASFFGFSPLDARLMDPQQRIFLECAWQAVENAGYDPTRYRGSIGIFGGAGIPRYWLERVASLGLRPGTTAEHRAVTGNPWQFLATLVSYKLGLRGPALTLQTACSTSLVAVHLACRHLLSRQCDIALAGGVSLYSLAEAGYLHEEGGILSPDGHCRPFDANARGTVPGSGVALVVLKRLSEALEDGDTIRAVIRGSAINNDGGRKVGYTAPSVEGQSDVITQAYAMAGISMDSVSYVEAHGTGTSLGDPIEIAALTRAFRQGTSRTGYCMLGSVKSNVGHLDAAAGVTGLIKAALAVEHGIIPGTVHFQTPNPNFEIEQSPFLVSSSSLPWKTPDDAPRRAGVSSFGIGGTNAHVLVEEPPPQIASGPSRSFQLLLISAKTGAALDTASYRLADYLREHAHIPLADVAFTLQQGRAAMSQRRAVVCNQADAAAEGIESGDASSVFSGIVRNKPPKVVFMFPGVGTQQVGMGSELYGHERIYREALDRCALLFQSELGIDIRTLLFPEDARREDVAKRLLRASLNMAVIFATEYALAQLLLAWGLRPAAVTGHSLGEYAAACVAGMLSVEDAVTLVALRGRLCDDMPASTMLIVPLSAAEVTRRIGEELSLAAINSPSHCVVSGALAAIEALEASLNEEGVQARRLPLTGSLHSALVEPAMARLARRAASMTLHVPKIPVVSNVTGTWMTDADAQDPAYWARHLRRTVRFADGLATLLADPDHVLLEVGPGKTLATLALLHPNTGSDRLVTTTMPQQGSSRTALEALLCAIAQLWCAGVEVDWAAFSQDERRHRVPLPTYPFDRNVYLLETVAQDRRRFTSAPPPPSVRREPDNTLQIPRTAPSPRQSDIKVRPAAPKSRMTSVEETLAGVWRELLGVGAVRPGDNFFDLGGNSLLAVQFRNRIKERLHTEITVHALLEHPTFSSLLELIKHDNDRPAETTTIAFAPGDRAPATTALGRNRLLVQIQPGSSARPPLFLVQPIGGTVFTYVDLAQQLGPDQAVHGLRASGMEPGEPIYADVPTIAARYVEEIRAFQPRGPYFLGGHSSGGIIAYEIAVQLLALGEDVPTVIMVDSVSIEQSRRLRVNHLEDVARLVEGFKTSAPRAFQMFTTTLEENSTFREIVLQTNKALASYEPHRCRAGVLFVRARERDDVLDAHPETSWMEIAEGSFVTHNAPGNHFTMLEPPNVSTVARIIRQHIDSLSSAQMSRRQEVSGERSPMVSVTSPFGLRVEGLDLESIAKLLMLVDKSSVTITGSNVPARVDWPLPHPPQRDEE